MVQKLVWLLQTIIRMTADSKGRNESLKNNRILGG